MSKVDKSKFRYIGKPMEQLDQKKFLYGGGDFVGNFSLPGMLYVGLVTSPYAHAKIKSIDTSEAKKVVGVVGVYTGEDLIPYHKAPLPVNIPSLPSPHQYILAVGKVRHYGEPVAVVVANDVKTAKIAARKVKVEYEPLPVVIDPEEAIKDGAPQLHDGIKNNIAYHDTFVYGDPDKAFKEADVIYSDRFYYHLTAANPIETLGAVSKYDPLTGEMYLWSNWQNPR